MNQVTYKGIQKSTKDTGKSQWLAQLEHTWMAWT